MHMHRLLAVAVTLSLLQPLSALSAGLFSDVIDTHPFKGEIESLARQGILKGNPDGTFRPEKSVNRAEFLKMLFTATNRSPKAIYAGCFGDVEKGSWYEMYVCDAAAKENGFVKGYSDGKFRPSSPVSRTEALKMLFMLFGLSAPDITADDKAIIKFVDVSTSAWYSKYLSAAYVNGILPITGFGGTRFYPEQELLRSEAAAYIFNAQNAKDRPQSSSSSSSSSAASTTTLTASSSSSSAPKEIMKSVVFPFTDSDTFIGARPAAYLFTLSAKTNVKAQVTVSGYYPSEVTCRLYRLEADDFSNEYYLGYQEKAKCTVQATLKPGKYQLQLQPTTGGVPYTVTTTTFTGDSNDGFVNAILLNPAQPRTSTLDADDLLDWYTFSLSTSKSATIELTSAESIGCVIYTPASVDQFGFTGPECGKPYLFNANDMDDPYYIGISRRTGDTIHRIPYTVNFR